jgi:class 3 adenylate cyclase
MSGSARTEVRPFTEKQIAPLLNFAAQAAIAIENARLLNELRQRTADLSESLEQQTATSEVLRVISSSPGDLKPVFDTIVRRFALLCGSVFGSIFTFDGELVHFAGGYGFSPEQLEGMRRKYPVRIDDRSVLPSRAILAKAPLHIQDIRADPDYDSTHAALGSWRRMLAMPMLHDGVALGAIVAAWAEAGATPRQHEDLLKIFANQAVIAIENARLLSELRETTDQLKAQSQQLVTLNQQLEQRVADQVGEIERMGRLRRFLPPQVADLIVASGTEKQLESHRREITALFCDLRGFTGFSESSDPEDVMALLREYHAAIGEIIIKYSGTLERFAGDGVMVIFNDPVPVENPALQAVLMALDMRTAIGAMIEKWRDLGHDLGFGIGIAHGFATLGTIGFEGRFDYAAIGTVSNVASRLCDEAKPGQILISPRVRQAVEKAVTVEPVGDFALKGIRRPMAAFNVLARSSSKPN